MPDAGDPKRDEYAASPPTNWGEAFAALPMAPPDAQAWQRLQSRLPASTALRSRWPLWLAVAASLALAAAIPLRLRQAPPVAPSAAGASARIATADAAAPADAPSVRMPIATQRDAEDIATTSAPTRVAGERHKRPPRLAPSQQPIRTVAAPAGTPRLATANDPGLDALYAESAQLEGLLTLARDEQVAGGSGAALVDALDQRVAGIDDALADPALDAGLRTRLWGERVEALRQLVGIETTQRLLSARGESYDAALVSID